MKESHRPTIADSSVLGQARLLLAFLLSLSPLAHCSDRINSTFTAPAVSVNAGAHFKAPRLGAESAPGLITQQIGGLVFVARPADLNDDGTYETLVPLSLASHPGIAHLMARSIFDPAQGWWDLTGFQAHQPIPATALTNVAKADHSTQSTAIGNIR